MVSLLALDESASAAAGRVGQRRGIPGGDGRARSRYGPVRSSNGRVSCAGRTYSIGARCGATRIDTAAGVRLGRRLDGADLDTDDAAALQEQVTLSAPSYSIDAPVLAAQGNV